MNKQQHRLYLLLGTNLGNKINNLNNAIKLLQNQMGKLICKSHIYETEPWQIDDQDPFYNQAILLETSLNPEECLRVAEQIEQNMGRTDKSKNKAREIDIDVLLYDQIQFKNSVLEIPHPRLHFRNFCLIPLMEIAGEEIHPVLNKSIEELYDLCEDQNEVILLDEDAI